MMVLDSTGEVLYIIHRGEEVTEFVQLKQRGEQQDAQNEALRRRAEQMAEWQAALIVISSTLFRTLAVWCRYCGGPADHTDPGGPSIGQVCCRPCVASRRISPVELPAFFSFLFRPTIDATNWRAEQTLRPAVVI